MGSKVPKLIHIFLIVDYQSCVVYSGTTYHKGTIILKYKNMYACIYVPHATISECLGETRKHQNFSYYYPEDEKDLKNIKS